MARESFDDPSTAALLNDGFICVRVDREERPDIDQVYQLAHQLLRRTGGGWPLTIFLSPQGVPFYSGTYFPRHAQADQPAFGAVLGSVSTVWSERRDALAQQDRALLARMAAALRGWSRGCWTRRRSACEPGSNSTAPSTCSMAASAEHRNLRIRAT